jgi:hypothetical protein
MQLDEEKDKRKRPMSDEHKKKLIEGRKKYWETKANSPKVVVPKKTISSPVAPEVIIPKRDMKIFGSVDRDSKGKITSEFPAWYFDQQKDELERGIAQDEAALDQEAIPYPAKAKFREKLSQRKERLSKINEETPKLKGSEEDSMMKIRGELGESIGEAHFTRSQREKGLADAHEEVRRMTEPVIKVKNEHQAEFIKNCGINIRDGKITRNEAEKVYKIASKMLDQPTDIEYLRRA